MTVQIHCPFCEETYDLDEFPEGAHTICERCGHEFVIDMSVVGPGAKSSQTTQVPPAPPRPPVLPGSSPAPEMNDEPKGRPVKTAIPPARKFTPPIIAQVFKFLAILDFIATALLLVLVLDTYNQGKGYIFSLLIPLGTFFWGIIMLGIGELASHIGEIRHHAIRQTELLTIIAER